MQMLSIECSFILIFFLSLPSGLQNRTQNTSNNLILGSLREDAPLGWKVLLRQATALFNVIGTIRCKKKMKRTIKKMQQ